MPLDVNAGADKVSAAEKAEASKKSAAEGASSVAEAVKRVADAAVAEVQKVPAAVAQDFSFAGAIGGRFTIRGKGFSTNGAVSFGGVGAATTEWGDGYIVGRVPDGIKPGLITIEVIVDPQTRQKGTFRL